MTTQLKFEVGKYYRRRDGSVRRLAAICAEAIFSLWDDAGANYTDNGRYIDDHQQHVKDLIEEVFITTELPGEPATPNPADTYLRALSIHLTPEAEHKRKRWEAAVAAMQASITHGGFPISVIEEARASFGMADAMLEVEEEVGK